MRRMWICGWWNTQHGRRGQWFQKCCLHQQMGRGAQFENTITVDLLGLTTESNQHCSNLSAWSNAKVMQVSALNQRCIGKVRHSHRQGMALNSCSAAQHSHKRAAVSRGTDITAEVCGLGGCEILSFWLQSKTQLFPLTKYVFDLLLGVHLQLNPLKQTTAVAKCVSVLFWMLFDIRDKGCLTFGPWKFLMEFNLQSTWPGVQRELWLCCIDLHNVFTGWGHKNLFSTLWRGQ